MSRKKKFFTFKKMFLLFLIFIAVALYYFPRGGAYIGAIFSKVIPTKVSKEEKEEKKKDALVIDMHFENGSLYIHNIKCDTKKELKNNIIQLQKKFFSRKIIIEYSPNDNDPFVKLKETENFLISNGFQFVEKKKTMTKKQLTPPKYTASCGLFFTTILLFAAITVIYIYQHDKWDFSLKKEDLQNKIIKVNATMDLDKILKTLDDNTTLLLEDGIYNGRFRIKGKSNIILKSNPASKKVIIKSLKGTALSIKDCKNCTVENIYLQSKDTEAPSLAIYHVETILLKNINIDNPLYAIKIEAKSSGITILKSTFCGSITIDNSKDLIMRTNVIKTIQAEFAIKISNHIQLFLNKNTVKSGIGVILKGISSEKNYMSSISENSIIGSKKNALLLDNCSDFSITSNSIEGKTDSAVSLFKSKNIFLGKLGVKNKIKTEHGYGVFISGCENSYLKDNWILNHDRNFPALMVASSQKIECIKNKITGSSFYNEGTMKEIKGGGIIIKRSLDILIDKNEILKGSLEGISIEDKSTVQIKNNMIKENWGNGIRMEASQGDISKNKIIKNMHGINMRNSTGTIQKNYISYNKKDGILLEASSPNILNNIMKSNNNGISLERNSIPKIKQNTFIKNKGFGISFLQPTFIDCEKDNIFKQQEKKINR